MIEELLSVEQHGENWLAAIYVKRNRYNNQIVISKNNKDVLTLTDNNLRYFTDFINTDNVMGVIFNIHNRMESGQKKSIIVEEGALVFDLNGGAPILGILTNYEEHISKCISMDRLVHSVPISFDSILPSKYDNLAYELSAVQMPIAKHLGLNSFLDLGEAVVKHINSNYGCL
jgi:hypothetical protein